MPLHSHAHAAQAMPAHLVRMLVRFSGHVQGVGFRFTVRQLAERYDVNGYVKNLSDGRVELLIEGSELELTGLLTNVRQRMSDYIDSVEIDTSIATGEYRSFDIKR